jgi:hypothetical protein
MARKKSLLLSENTIQAALLKIFAMRDWFAWPTHDRLHIPAQGGVNDVIALKSGLTIYVECESEGWRPAGEGAKLSKTEASQRRFRAQIERHGGTYPIVQTIDQVITVLTAINKIADQYILIEVKDENHE